MSTETDPAPRARGILDMNSFDLGSGEVSPAVRRRLANLGSASVLFYRNPIEMVSAEGAWMIARDGQRYLDMYNNVPVVGHGHPEVIEAVTRQMRQLNTHTRYVVGVVDDYIEALKATLPAGLDNVVLTCSGSEANDLAMRLARRVSGGQGIIVTENAYHGNTAIVTEVSPAAIRNTALAEHVVTVPAPSRENFGDDIAGGFAGAVEAAIRQLRRRGIAPAALLVDTIFSSDGVHADPAGFLVPAVAAMRKAGGLFIADEVQPGFGRTGEAFWAVQRHGIEPDILTMGKPMGNGFPMAAMATHPEYLDAYCDDYGYFNTFGGNPVAAAAGHATLRVIQREGLMENARDIGARLRAELRAIADRSPCLAAVRGTGLFIGIDVCEPDRPRTPAPERTLRILEALQGRNILTGSAGKFGATIRVRPPLCITRDQADIFIDTFSAIMSEMEGGDAGYAASGRYRPAGHEYV
ncbi:aspartate aminotransferase family protein [Ruixingdingia sedimenti]|uniref:Aspartate aminotransferase family protein n=1 Tax=Ruixingdingia sedimenti TaxID=3073604 RepID=A0ABU1F589_9RHOB|nr:aspartate aminotransferase family protein [Xinfangfangia sp. LG-4]MDR5652038.1 aspartate aminotransferase family protein [Xinfangfangia sp. LG-4]